MSWSAAQYMAFEAERTRPVRDLVAAIETDPVRTAVDLGCGPGNSTEALIQRFPEAAVSGLDSSPDMVAAARQRLPRIDFAVADAADWRPTAPLDLVFANAVFQWVPDHQRLFPHLMEALAPGGSLAVQMPDNLGEPAHVLMRETAAKGPWRAKLAAAATARPALRPAERYYDLLRPLAAKVDIWRTTYHPVLEGGVAAVIEWFKGTGLRPFLTPLDEPERGAFLAAY
ncbi:MAG: trans-aconitate 2-methyltransferase, partial [Caulobacteraceae bacterium]|nr:trans-aconitate 2-methyltransferase [Caulobacteraceae bacterium]